MKKIEVASQYNCSPDQVKNITESTMDPPGNQIHNIPNELRCCGDQEQKTGIAPEEYGKARERSPEGLISRLRQRIINSRRRRIRCSMYLFSCCLRPMAEEEKESRMDNLENQQVVQQRAEEQHLQARKRQFTGNESIEKTNFPKGYKIGRFTVTKPNQEDNLLVDNKENNTKIMKKKRQCVTDPGKNNQEAKTKQSNVNKQMPKANVADDSKKGRFTITKANYGEHLVLENKEYRKCKPKVTKMKRRRMTDLEKNIRFIEKTVWDFDTRPYSSESQ